MSPCPNVKQKQGLRLKNMKKHCEYFVSQAHRQIFKPPQVHSQDAAKAAINAKAARQKHKQCPLCLNVLKISDLLSNLN